MSRIDVYQSVTDRIIEALEQGTAPWRKPWRGGGPENVRNGRAYRGINVFLLEMQNYADPRWGTYKAIKEAGGHVRKGEKATWIVLWKRATKSKAKMAEDPEQSPNYYMLRYFSVFNAEQAEGLPEYELPFENDPIERAEQIALGYVGPTVEFGGSSAYYSPTTDSVRVPLLNQHESAEAYYSTLYHELIHSTGHKSRLDRLETTGFGSGPYAKEELVAEMGAAMLCGMAGIENLDQSAAYVSGWLERLRDDSKFVVQAAGFAQRASDLILGTSFEEESNDEVALAAA